MIFKMKNIEEFFKNRVLLTWDDSIMGDYAFERNFNVKWAFEYESKIFDPLSLNYTNIFDLVKKINSIVLFWDE